MSVVHLLTTNVTSNPPGTFLNPFHFCLLYGPEFEASFARFSGGGNHGVDFRASS